MFPNGRASTASLLSIGKKSSKSPLLHPSFLEDTEHDKSPSSLTAEPQTTSSSFPLPGFRKARPKPSPAQLRSEAIDRQIQAEAEASTPAVSPPSLAAAAASVPLSAPSSSSSPTPAKQSNDLSILLLGQQGAGKTTILKQMRLLYDADTHERERNGWRLIIFLNIISAARFMLDRMQESEAPDDAPPPPLGRSLAASSRSDPARPQLAPLLSQRNLVMQALSISGNSGSRLTSRSEINLSQPHHGSLPTPSFSAQRLKALRLRLAPLLTLEKELREELGAIGDEVDLSRSSHLGPTSSSSAFGVSTSPSQDDPILVLKPGWQRRLTLTSANTDRKAGTTPTRTSAPGTSEAVAVPGSLHARRATSSVALSNLAKSPAIAFPVEEESRSQQRGFQLPPVSFVRRRTGSTTSQMASISASRRAEEAAALSSSSSREQQHSARMLLSSSRSIPSLLSKAMASPFLKGSVTAPTTHHSMMSRMSAESGCTHLSGATTDSGDDDQPDGFAAHVSPPGRGLGLGGMETSPSSGSGNGGGCRGGRANHFKLWNRRFQHTAFSRSDAGINNSSKADDLRPSSPTLPYTAVARPAHMRQGSFSSVDEMLSALPRSAPTPESSSERRSSETTAFGLAGVGGGAAVTSGLLAGSAPRMTKESSSASSGCSNRASLHGSIAPSFKVSIDLPSFRSTPSQALPPSQSLHGGWIRRAPIDGEQEMLRDASPVDGGSDVLETRLLNPALSSAKSGLSPRPVSRGRGGVRVGQGAVGAFGSSSTESSQGGHATPRRGSSSASSAHHHLPSPALSPGSTDNAAPPVESGAASASAPEARFITAQNQIAVAASTAGWASAPATEAAHFNPALGAVHGLALTTDTPVFVPSPSGTATVTASSMAANLENNPLLGAIRAAAAAAASARPRVPVHKTANTLASGAGFALMPTPALAPALVPTPMPTSAPAVMTEERRSSCSPSTGSASPHLHSDASLTRSSDCGGTTISTSMSSIASTPALGETEPLPIVNDLKHAVSPTQEGEVEVEEDLTSETLKISVAGMMQQASMVSLDDPAELLAACKEEILGLWVDSSAAQHRQRGKFQSESDVHLMNNLDRIAAPYYVPTDTDILHARVRTLGVTEQRFQISPTLSCRLFDVGGSTYQRKAWSPFFDNNVDAFIFVAPLSAYDQTLSEDGSTNRLQDSLDLFRSIMDSPLLRRASVILFLNKVDVLRRKLKVAAAMAGRSGYLDEHDGQVCYEGHIGGRTYTRSPSYPASFVPSLSPSYPSSPSSSDDTLHIQHHFPAYRGDPYDFDSVLHFFRSAFMAIAAGAHYPASLSTVTPTRPIFVHATVAVDRGAVGRVLPEVVDVIVENNSAEITLL
ncbi:hypothetical protein OC835_004725 [Tilletia horrida]|nr:hypothetical protein OC835_004725 [Tilletia horrida]